MKQLSLKMFGLIGIVLFLPLFLFTFSDPQLIEKSAQTFVEWKLQNAVNEKIDSIQPPRITKLETLLNAKTNKLRIDTEKEINKVKAQLKSDAPALIAAQIAQMRNLDCECRKKWEQRIKISMQSQLINLETMKEKLTHFSQVKYMEIVQKLTLDVRIFLGINTAVFIFLLILSLLKPKAITHLFLPGVLMLLSTIICSYFYLFEQNWLYTILYNDYTGLGYLFYLGLVFAVLCDIALNKARITSEIINGISQALGHTLTVVPC